MSHKYFVRAGATMAAAALATLSFSPGASAAEPAAEGSGEAVKITLAGTAGGTGTYSATHDGEKETTSGSNADLLGMLPGGLLFPTSTLLVQDVQTTVQDRNGTVAACAGVAGPGAEIRRPLTAAQCLSGGGVLNLSLGALDLGGLEFTEAGLSDIPLLGGLTGLLQTVIDSLLGDATGALTGALGDIGNPGIFLELGAVEGSCQATPTGASGTANIADAKVYIQMPAPIGRIDLVNLPANPAPNTSVVTQLGDVVDVILDAVETQLTTALGGALSPIAGLLEPLDVVTTLLNQLSSQLAPLEQIVDVDLNKQVKTGKEITVTALDLNVLSAARAFIDDSLVNVSIGEVHCGPSARMAAKPTPTPTPTSTPTPDEDEPDDTPIVTTNYSTPRSPIATPTAVHSGLGDPDSGTPWALIGLGSLGLVGAGLSTTVFRRHFGS